MTWALLGQEWVEWATQWEACRDWEDSEWEEALEDSEDSEDSERDIVDWEVVCSEIMEVSGIQMEVVFQLKVYSI